MSKARAIFATVVGLSTWREVDIKTNELVNHQDYEERYRGGKSIADMAFGPLLGTLAALGIWSITGLLARVVGRPLRRTQR